MYKVEQKKVPFFRKLKNAITNFDEYQKFSKETLGTTIKYFLKFMLIFSVLISAFFTARLYREVNELSNFLQSDCPNFKIENNTLIIEGETKQYEKNFEQEYVGVIVDADNTELKEEQKFGVHSMKVSVGLRGNEESEPYRVNAFYFSEGNGLYLILAYQELEAVELFKKLLDSLSYSGLGGKRSAGLGRFEYMEHEMPDELKEKLQKKADKYMLLSVALPEDQEMEKILENASYSVLKRSGFVSSETYAEQQRRKRDLYVFDAGSCFEKTFEGRLIEEREGGRHSVFRYEKALFLGVDI